MGAARSLRESALIKGPVSLVLGIGVLVVCGALVAISAIGLVIAVPVTYLQRWWSRLGFSRR
jgi:hypothetical protein